MTNPCKKCGSTEKYKNGRCIPCARAYSKQYYLRKAKNIRKKYTTMQAKARQHKYYQDNAERIKARRRQYYRENTEKARASQRRYAKANKEKERERQRKWYKAKKQREAALEEED